VQSLSDPPPARELAQFLDPDGMAYSFRLETSGDETTAHPTGWFGPVYVWFLRFICALIVLGFGVGVIGMWGDHPLLAVAIYVAMVVMLLATYSFMMRFFKWMNQFYLVHGTFARWNPAAGTIELLRLGVTLHLDRLVGAVCLTGGEWCNGVVRCGAWCPRSELLPEDAAGKVWVQANELSVIVQTADGTLTRYPLVTVENPWRFREFAASFATEFGLPLQVIALNRAKRRELRNAGWKHPGEFADADRPRKVAAGRVAVSDGSFPGFGKVTLCRPRKTGAPNEVMGDSPRADSSVS
jgi:hypothetical protein